MSEKTDKSSKKEITISPETLAISSKLLPHLKLVDGAVAPIPAEAIIETLPEDVTAEMYQKVESHRNQFFAGASHAMIEFSSAEMAKDKSITSLEASFPMFGRDHFDVNVDRKRQFTVGDKPPVTQWCVLDAAYVVHGARTKVGELSKVKAYGRDIGEKILAVLAD